MYALFNGDEQIGAAFPTEEEVWQNALAERLVTDLPVADEEGGQVLPKGYHVKPTTAPTGGSDAAGGGARPAGQSTRSECGGRSS